MGLLHDRLTRKNEDLLKSPGSRPFSLATLLLSRRVGTVPVTTIEVAMWRRGSKTGLQSGKPIRIPIIITTPILFERHARLLLADHKGDGIGVVNAPRPAVRPHAHAIHAQVFG